jgi:hypothetical protein
MRRYSLLSGLIFGLVALLQAVRVIAGWAVQIGHISVPVWFSWVTLNDSGSFSILAFRSRT